MRNIAIVAHMVLLGVLVSLHIGCSGRDDGGPPPPPPEGAGYYWHQGNCYSQSSGQPTNHSNCTGHQNNQNGRGTDMSNGACYSEETNQQVDLQNCQQGVGGDELCFGEFFLYSNNVRVPVFCSGSNCSGATVNRLSGEAVNCQ